MSYLFDLSIYDWIHTTNKDDPIRITISGSVQLVDKDGEVINSYPFFEMFQPGI